jgi:SSS family solute:Na+ symporter
LPERLRNVASRGDELFPYFIAHGMPAGLRGLVIAALFSAAMSSLSSGVNSVTTVLTVDLLGRGRAAAPPSPRRVRVLAGLIGLATIAIALPFAFTHYNLYELINRTLDPLTGPLFGLFLLAFFDRRASAASAWFGVAIGATVGLGCAFAPDLLRASGYGVRVLPFWSLMPISIGATAVPGWLFGRCFPARVSHPTAEVLPGQSNAEALNRDLSGTATRADPRR